MVARKRGVGGGCSTQPGRSIPPGTRRTRRTLRARSVGARHRGALRCLGRVLIAGLRQSWRGLRWRSGQGRGGAARGAGRAGPGCRRGALGAGLGIPARQRLVRTQRGSGGGSVLDVRCGRGLSGTGVGARCGAPGAGLPTSAPSALTATLSQPVRPRCTHPSTFPASHTRQLNHAGMRCLGAWLGRTRADLRTRLLAWNASSAISQTWSWRPSGVLGE